MITYKITPRALLAQGIERLPPEQKVAGSNPAEGAIRKHNEDGGNDGFVRARISAQR